MIGKRLKELRIQKGLSQQELEFMTNLLKEKWKDEEWKKKHLAKMFDGSKKV